MIEIRRALIPLLFAATACTQLNAPCQSAQTPAIPNTSGAGEVGLGAPPACPADLDDNSASAGIAKVKDKDVTPPKPVHTVDARFTKDARQAIKKNHIRNFEAVSFLNLVVDEDGRPQNICLKKAAGYGLDAEASKAVSQYRFEPAKKDGKPIPVHITVEVNFKIY